MAACRRSRRFGPEKRLSSRLRKFLLASIPIAAAIAIFFVISRDAIFFVSRNATWTADPGDGIYDNASNWSSGAVPDGTAYFGASSRSDLTFRRGYIPRYVFPNHWGASRQGWISVGGWTFNRDAANYQFKIGPASYPINETPRVPCTGERIGFTGAGIVVNGGSVSFINDSCLAFVSKSTAGAASIVNNKWLEFYDGGTAGRSSIVNNNVLRFLDATAGDASITNNFEMEFRGASTAASSTIVNKGRIWFLEKSTGGNAAINNVAPDAVVIFDEASVSMGSIAGPGQFDLRKAGLTVGSNNQSTTVSGVITDLDGWNEREASLVKTGAGTLTLTGTNSYACMTVVDHGTLAVNGFNARSRLTEVNSGGALKGTGTVGHTLIRAGGTLAPGVADTPGSSIDIAGNLALQHRAIYTLQVDPSTATFAKITGNAALLGATLNVAFGPGSYVERKYTILDVSGKIVGSFGQAITATNLPDGFKVELSYDNHHVYLSLLSCDRSTIEACRN